MKKLVLLLMFLPMTCFGFGTIKTTINFQTAIPFLGHNLGEFDVLNKQTEVLHDAKLGDPSTGVKIDVLYSLSDKLYLGPSFEYNYFSHDKASGLELNVSTRNLITLLKFRYYFNPDSLYRVYLPIGVGIHTTEVKIESKAFRDTNFAFSTGLGLERYLYKNIYLNLEVKYNYNQFNTENQYYKLRPRANYISYLVGITF